MWFILASILLIIFLITYILYKASHVPIPKHKETAIFHEKLKIDNDFRKFGSAFLQKNPFRFYEVYAEGDTFERAYATGQVLKEIKEQHEDNFIGSINELVPNQDYLQFLKWIVGILNRNLYKYFTKEYLLELYALSFSSSKKYEYIAPAYQRVLNYHAAHDIGHALQNMGLVACSSFITKGSQSCDGQLLMARNLDFSPSEDFNQLKVLYFIKPAKGFRFISYSWPGFIGVVSGMNEHGLCVVIHAAKSKMRISIGTPVSIVAREILQYASNLEEARKILKKRKTFVSELFLVCSAKDKNAIIFEKEPESLTEYQMQGNELICVNHLQSAARKNEEENLNWQKEISSAYRFERLKELLNNHQEISPNNAAEILRDVKGKQNENIGLQNENAINQLAAHHGIIFKPESLEFWVSSTEYVLGKFVAYNFNEAFSKASALEKCVLYTEEKNIEDAPLLKSEEYKQFTLYRLEKVRFKKSIKNKVTISKNELETFEKLNPNLFTTYEILADYFLSQNESEKAKKYLSLALQKNIPTQFDKKRIENKWKKL